METSGPARTGFAFTTQIPITSKDDAPDRRTTRQTRRHDLPQDVIVNFAPFLRGVFICRPSIEREPSAAHLEQREPGTATSTPNAVQAICNRG